MISPRERVHDRVIENEMAKGTEFIDMTYLRTGSLTDGVTPESFLQLERQTLKEAGFMFDFKRGV